MYNCTEMNAADKNKAKMRERADHSTIWDMGASSIVRQIHWSLGRWSSCRTVHIHVVDASQYIYACMNCCFYCTIGWTPYAWIRGNGVHKFYLSNFQCMQLRILCAVLISAGRTAVILFVVKELEECSLCIIIVWMHFISWLINGDYVLEFPMDWQVLKMN